jgi:hypothetical protein
VFNCLRGVYGNDVVDVREQISSELGRLARATGHAPGQTLFARETGIAAHHWRGKFRARSGDARADAGYRPHEWTLRLATGQVLLKIIEACRHSAKLPTRAELEMYRLVTYPLARGGNINSQMAFDRRAEMRT